MPKTEKILRPLYDGTIEITFYPNSHRYKLGDRDLLSVTAATDVVDKSAQLIHWAVNLVRGYLLDIKDTGEHISRNDIELACKQHKIRKEKAADIGTDVHAWAEAYAKGENPKLPEGDDERSQKTLNGVLAFLKWVDENEVKFIETEKLVYSKEHDYVGTMDLAFTMGKEKHKIFHMGDYKTASGIYSGALYQTAGYLGAYLEEHGKKIKLPIGNSFILRFAKEDKFDKENGELIEEAGTFEVREITADDYAKNYTAFLGCLAVKRREKELSSHGTAYRLAKKST